MRASFALPSVVVALALCAAPAAAQSPPDRYGPARSAATLAMSAYGGRMLTWSGKSAEQVPAPVEQAAPSLVRPAPAVFAPPPLVAPAPAAAPAPAPAPIARLTERAAPPSAPQPAPQPFTVAATAPAALRAPGGGAPTRLYSLHRAYGLSPDPAPQVESAPRYVLIAPAEAPATAAPDDADQERPF